MVFFLFLSMSAFADRTANLGVLKRLAETYSAAARSTASSDSTEELAEQREFDEKSQILNVLGPAMIGYTAHEAHRILEENKYLDGNMFVYYFFKEIKSRLGVFLVNALLKIGAAPCEIKRYFLTKMSPEGKVLFHEILSQNLQDTLGNTRCLEEIFDKFLTTQDIMRPFESLLEQHKGRMRILLTIHKNYFLKPFDTERTYLTHIMEACFCLPIEEQHHAALTINIFGDTLSNLLNQELEKEAPLQPSTPQRLREKLFIVRKKKFKELAKEKTHDTVALFRAISETTRQQAIDRQKQSVPEKEPEPVVSVPPNEHSTARTLEERQQPFATEQSSEIIATKVCTLPDITQQPSEMHQLDTWASLSQKELRIMSKLSKNHIFSELAQGHFLRDLKGEDFEKFAKLIGGQKVKGTRGSAWEFMLPHFPYQDDKCIHVNIDLPHNRKSMHEKSMQTLSDAIIATGLPEIFTAMYEK